MSIKLFPHNIYLTFIPVHYNKTHKESLMNNVPQVGQYIIRNNEKYVIVKVYKFGTMDVKDKNDNYFRMTGLGFIKP